MEQRRPPVCLRPLQQASVPSTAGGRDGGTGGGAHAASDVLLGLVLWGEHPAGGPEAFGLGLSAVRSGRVST